MLKLLIVDDEPMFREGLIKTINWGALGISIVGEAYNGIEAMKILEKKSIDLIITDIRMPEMDGIELIRRVTVEYPNTRFIVLSAFDDFQLVKQAFQLGIVDYILKSEIRESDLQEIMNRQSKEVSLRKSFFNLQKTEYAERNSRLIMQQLLRNCVDRKLSLKETPQLQEYFTYSEEHPFYSVVLCLHHTDFSLEADSITQDLKKGIFLIDSSIANRNEWIGYIESHYLYLFHIPKKQLNWMEFSNRTEELRIELLQILRVENPSWELTAGFSSVRKSSILSRQKLEAEKACHFSFLRGINKSIGYNHYQASLTNPISDVRTMSKRFVTALKNWDIHNISADIVQYQLNPLYCNGSFQETIVNLYSKYYHHLLSFCEQMGIEEVDSINESFKKFTSILASSAPLDQMNVWLKETVNIIHNKMEDRHSLVGQVIRYLHNHYSSDLSLTEVADFFHVNSSYLSRTFSKEAGKGFSSYLTELRINKALNIMEEGNLKIYEIAEQVGMPNPESFSRSFKKITGISPREYYK